MEAAGPRETNQLSSIVCEPTISKAWLAAAELLRARGREAFALLVEITDANLVTAQDEEVRNLVDEHLAQQRSSSIETVGETIFPTAFYNDSDAKSLYKSYEENWPLIKEIDGSNKNGTYFRRLTHYEGVDRMGEVCVVNPLEYMIEKIRKQKATRSAKRTVYPFSIYNAAIDRNVNMGFPCMTFMDIKMDGDSLHLTAQYRNQMYITKAFGNFVGLSNLLDFLVEQTGTNRGHVLCIATHAQLDGGVRETNKLLTKSKKMLA